MKELKILFTAILTVCLSISTALSQEETNLKFTVNFGLSVPKSPNDFSDFWNFGFTAGGGADLAISPSFMVNGSVLFHRFGFDEDNYFRKNGVPLDVGFSSNSSSVKVLTFMLSAKLIARPDEPHNAYVLAGLGVFRMWERSIKISENNVLIYQSEVESETVNGFNVGAGVQFEIFHKYHIVVETRYFIGTTSGNTTQLFPFIVGFRF